MKNRRIRRNEPFTDTTADESQNNNTEGKKPEKNGSVFKNASECMTQLI